MPKRRIRIALFMVFAIAFYSVALGHPINVVDTQGRTLTISNVPETVVCLVPAATDLIESFGVSRTLKGICSSDEVFLDDSDVAFVAADRYCNIERVRSLNPDIILALPEHLPKIKNIRVPVFVFQPASLNQDIAAIEALGQIFNRAEQAAERIAQIRNALCDLGEKIKSIEMENAWRTAWIMENGLDLKIQTGPSIYNDLIRAAGGVALDSDLTNASAERIIQWNPQVIIANDKDRSRVGKFLAQEKWARIDAVKNHRIHFLPDPLIRRVAAWPEHLALWLSARMYAEKFASADPIDLTIDSQTCRPIDLDLSYVREAEIIYGHLWGFPVKTLVVDFRSPQAIISTLDGFREKIDAVGNHYGSPGCWEVGHRMGLEVMKSSMFQMLERSPETDSFLMTGADMDHLAISRKTFKQMSVYALVTAGVRSNAMRMSRDEGSYYEAGTINIILLTNMSLTPRAMSRAVITATEAKTAALTDMDIRSAYDPLRFQATGTGTDNIIVVQGQGRTIDNAGGHTKLGELIAAAVHAGVKEAVFKQNRLKSGRNIFVRLAERKIFLENLALKSPDPEIAGSVRLELEKLLINQRYAGFLEAALSLSDDYESGMIHDLTAFESWCRQVCEAACGKKVTSVPSYFDGENLPKVVEMALSALIHGATEISARDEI